MQTLEKKPEAACEVSPADFTPEHIAAAYLMKRFEQMGPEALQDIVSLVQQWMNPDTPAEYHGEIFETIREILFPEMVGGICLGRAGAAKEMPKTLQRHADHVGKTIKRIRVEKGLKQTDLAKQSGLPQSHISRLEAGVHSPSLKTIEKVAKALGITAGDLAPSNGT